MGAPEGLASTRTDGRCEYDNDVSPAAPRSPSMRATVWPEASICVTSSEVVDTTSTPPKRASDTRNLASCAGTVTVALASYGSAVVTGEEPSLPRYRNVAPVVGLRSSNVVRPEIDGGVSWLVSVRSGSAWATSPPRL